LVLRQLALRYQW